MAYCHDLETNVRQTKTFTVKHLRHTRNGTTRLTDGRDIYEAVANNGARRLRACILGVIPQDVQELAIEQCNKTLAGNNDVPIEDRVRAMLEKFKSIGVTKEMVEARLTYAVTAIQPIDIANLGKIFNSIKDGVSKREDWFEANPGKAAKKVTTKKKEEETAKDEGPDFNWLDQLRKALEAAKTEDDVKFAESAFIPAEISMDDDAAATIMLNETRERLASS